MNGRGASGRAARVDEIDALGAGELGPGPREVAVPSHRLAVVLDRGVGHRGVARLEPPRKGFGAQVRVVGDDVGRRAGRELLRVGDAEPKAERLGDAAGDLRLHAEHVGERRVEALAPLGGGRGVGAHGHQLGGHQHPAHAVRLLRPADRPGEQVADAEVPGDVGRADLRAGVGNGAAAGDDLEAPELGELAAHGVGHAVGEVGLGRIADVLEREHGDAERGGGRRGRLRAGAPDVPRRERTTATNAISAIAPMAGGDEPAPRARQVASRWPA